MYEYMFHVYNIIFLLLCTPQPAHYQKFSFIPPPDASHPLIPYVAHFALLTLSPLVTTTLFCIYMFAFAWFGFSTCF